MKLLIAVVQCARDRWRIPAHREMLCGHGADVRFFYGLQGDPALTVTAAADDEVELPVDDAYFVLIQKVRAIFTWALAHDYEYVLKIDADTWLDVEKLLKAGFEQHDWVGLTGDKGASGGVGHCTSGGVGIWLSARAMRIYLEHWPKMPVGKHLEWDDWSLSLTLADAGVKLHHTDRLWNDILGAPPDEANLISRHGWSPNPERKETRGPS